MLNAWQRCAYALHVISIDLGQNKAGTVRQARHDFAPRADNHSITMRLAPIGVPAALRRRNQESEVFNSPGSQQRLPVRLTG